jgi:hypothetical protein
MTNQLLKVLVSFLSTYRQKNRFQWYQFDVRLKQKTPIKKGERSGTFLNLLYTRHLAEWKLPKNPISMKKNLKGAKRGKIEM